MLIDTYAWIEFFRGTESGMEAREVLRAERSFTSVVSIAEIAEWCLKNNLRLQEYVRAVTKGSVILRLDEQTASIAGTINHERKKTIRGWGMVDSLILATAVSYDLKILTGDSHFKDLPNVRML